MQEPNPLEEETWDTPGILDRLVPERNTTVNEDGEYCFTAKLGLWRLNVHSMEDEVGIHFKYGSERGSLAFIANDGVPNVRID